jgi:hypothetical protein
MRGACLSPKYSQIIAMQWTTTETATADGLLWGSGGSVKRVVIREDLMNGRTPFLKMTKVFAYRYCQTWVFAK